MLEQETVIMSLVEFLTFLSAVNLQKIIDLNNNFASPFFLLET